MTVLAADHTRSGASWLDTGADGMLRKKVNDMYAGLRDKVDADSYVVATGRDCSPNKIYTYRMLDTAYREIAGLFAAWRQHPEQVGAILGRTIAAMPIEARQMKAIGGCKAEWIIRWSESLERFGAGPGPLHTRSKRFASLKNSPDKIAAMLAEIGDYEELSSNLDRGDDWLGDAGEAALWMEDYWRVVSESEQSGAQPGVADRILPPREEEGVEYALDGAGEEDADPDDAREPPAEPPRSAAQLGEEQAVATALSLSPNYLEVARAAQYAGSWTLRVLGKESLPIRLAVYHKLLGPADDSYPDAWLDPQTGELPTLQQLAALDRISMPTMRKRRNEAIDKLYAANRSAAS
jgi:hypothetical protein